MEMGQRFLLKIDPRPTLAWVPRASLSDLGDDLV